MFVNKPLFPVKCSVAAPSKIHTAFFNVERDDSAYDGTDDDVYANVTYARVTFKPSLLSTTPWRTRLWDVDVVGTGDGGDDDVDVLSWDVDVL